MNRTQFDIAGKRIWIAGSRGMVGSALARRLKRGDEDDIVLIPDPRREAVDLRDQGQVRTWMAGQDIDIIIMAAARVGGIEDNRTNPADFIADNLQIQTNIITEAAARKVEKLVFLGSICIYPPGAPQPIREEELLGGYPEETNRAYAIAKIAGIELVRAMRIQHGHDFISLMPCNLYGPEDRHDGIRAHVIPALMEKIVRAMDNGDDYITVWGTGTPLREFMHVDDLADAVVFCLRHYSDGMPLNIGTGEEMTIDELARTLCAVAGFKGRIVYDAAKPDGVMRKIVDSSRLRSLGWQPRITVSEGLSTLWICRSGRARHACCPHGSD